MSNDPYGSDFPWYPSAHRQQQCEQALSAYKMTLGTVLGSPSLAGGSSSGSTDGSGGGTQRTIQVRDGRKYAVGEVATFKHATNTVTGRVVSNTPTPKLTAPDAATIVLDTSVNNSTASSVPTAKSAVSASAPAATASPQRSQAALAAERRAAGLPPSPSPSLDTGTSGSSADPSTSSSDSTGSLVTMSPSPAPVPLGPVPLQPPRTPGMPMSVW